MILDAHTHIIVPEMTREAAPDEAWRPSVTRENGQQVIEFGDRRLKSATQEFVDIEGILEAQAAVGVDHVLLSPWSSILGYKFDAEEGLRLSRIQNEALARLHQRYPQQVVAVGTVPMQEPELAARELEAVMGLPGLKGVEISATIQGNTLGDERFASFWAAAEALGAFVFIHPTTQGLGLPALKQYYMWNTVGNPLETTITAAHMIMAGVMERHPNLKVMLSHGGGAILALRGRLNHAHGFQPLARAELSESPETSLRRFYFDTITHDQSLLRELVEFAGADHVLLGSDYPFDMRVAQVAESVRALDLSAEDEAAILGGNAARLLGLTV